MKGAIKVVKIDCKECGNKMVMFAVDTEVTIKKCPHCEIITENSWLSVNWNIHKFHTGD